MRRFLWATGFVILAASGCGPSAAEQAAAKELQLATLALERGKTKDCVEHAERSIAEHDNEAAWVVRAKAWAAEQAKDEEWMEAFADVRDGLDKSPGNRDLLSLCLEYAQNDFDAKAKIITLALYVPSRLKVFDLDLETKQKTKFLPLLIDGDSQFVDELKGILDRNSLKSDPAMEQKYLKLLKSFEDRIASSRATLAKLKQQ